MYIFLKWLLYKFITEQNFHMDPSTLTVQVTAFILNYAIQKE